MKKILLAGDYYEEKLIFIQNGSGQVSLHSLPGGNKLLKKFLAAELPNDEIIVLENENDRIIEKIFEAKNFVPTETNSIRISRPIGYSILSDKIKQEIPLPSEADVVLTDDIHVSPEALTNLIDKPGKENNPFIVYTPGKSLAKSRLLNKLPVSYIEQFVVILDADDLREHGLQINGRLSWDKTLEDFRQEFNSNAIFNTLKKCKTLLIRFGLEAILYIFKSSAEETNPGKILQQFRFYYIPSLYEGQLQEQTEGQMNGTNEAFKACILKKMLYPDEATLTEREAIAASITPSMKAASNCLQAGYRINKVSGEIDYPISEIFKEDNLPVKGADLTEIMNSDRNVSLFTLHVFHSPELITYLSFRFVKEGISSSFDVFPYTEYNKIKTYDRDEIEGYRGLKKRINDYLSGNENKPLSVAVFGPPGSGKSFGVKQIAENFKKKISICEFNLSQFQSYDDLVNAFREISGINLSGKTPLVFFDEFDCDFEGKPLGWLIRF